MKKWLVVFLILFAMLPVNAVQQLQFEGFIADEANLLSREVKQNLNMTLLDLQNKSGADIAVVTLPSLNGQSVEDAALEIGRKYKVGSRTKLNGVVFLTVMSERKMRIELGTGLENKIKMETIERIRDNDILPYYRNYDYRDGITRGTYLLIDTVADVEGVSVDKYGTCPSKKSGSEGVPLWCYLIAAILAPFSGRRRRTGSFGGFGGGGSFGGCGCSGSW